MSLVNRKFLGLAVLLLMMVALFALPMHAQINYGAVRGLAKDAQGAVIPDAAVTLTNVGTGIVRTAKTNGSGEYEFTSVVPGDYVVEVSLKGFKNLKEPVTVDLGATVTADASLQVGAAGETVEVQTSQEPLIDTASASGGQAFTQVQLTELPNLGRNPFVFELLDNNVTPVGDPRYVRAEDQSGSSAVSIAGAPIGANSYVVDGIPTSTASGGVTFIPSPEAVSDAKTQGNTYDAEIGRTGGGTGNTSLKSGTDQYHGVLYGETRQTPWSANSWLNKHTTYLVNGVAQGPITPRPDVTTYLYAGAFGGKVPFFDKFKWTKQTFFFVTEEGYRQAQPLTGSGQLVVPTALEAAGNFSQDPITLFDPTSPFVLGASGCTATTACRSGIMGMYNGLGTANVIPASYLNPIGSWIAANAYPGVTNTASSYGQYTSQRSDDFKTRSDMYSGKLDHAFAPWWTSSVSYVHLGTQEPSGDFYGNKGNFSSDARLVRYNDATSIYNVFTINPTTIATVGYGFNRYFSTSYQYGLGFNLATGFGGAGFPSSFISNWQSQFGGKYSFPTISATQTSAGIGTFASLGGGFGGRGIPDASHNFVAGLQKTVGKQNLKMGYVYRALHVASTAVGANPSFSFPGNYTSRDGKSSSTDAYTSAITGSTYGSGLADLEMGLADTASIGLAEGNFNELASYHAVYFQDDFRANEKLTLNLGLRYEYELGEREVNNQLTVGFNPNIAYTIPTTTVGTTVEGGATFHGGLEYAGVNGAPIHTANQSHTKFSPRVGVAYEINKNTVFQAGFGVFYAPENVVAYNAGYTQSSSYTAGTGGNITAPITTAQLGAGAFLSNPFNGTTTGTLIPPSGNTLGYYTALGSTISVVDFKRTDPVVEQYSVDIERQLPWQTSLKVGYTGAHAKNFPLAVNINQLSDGVLAQLAACAEGTGVCPSTSTASTNYSSAAASNPYYLPTVSNGTTTYATGTTGTNTTSIPLGQLLLPYPQYSTVTLSESVGYSLYNAFNVKVVKRASKGLTLTFAYTWMSNWDNLYSGGSTLNSTSGPQDNYNLKGEYSRAVNDIPDRADASVLYDVPVGRGMRFGGGMPKWLDYVVGGYKVDAIIKRQTGGPLNITQGTNTGVTYGVSGFGGNVIRPNFSGTSPCYTGTPESRENNHGYYFNPAAFTAAPAFTYGNVPRSIGCKGPGLSDIDLNVTKTFSVTERVKIRFIAEALNVTNTAQFSVGGEALSTTKASTPGGTPTFTYAPGSTPFGGSTGSLSQINYNRFIQLGGRVFF